MKKDLASNLSNYTRRKNQTNMLIKVKNTKTVVSNEPYLVR